MKEKRIHIYKAKILSDISLSLKKLTAQPINLIQQGSPFLSPKRNIHHDAHFFSLRTCAKPACFCFIFSIFCKRLLILSRKEGDLWTLLLFYWH